MALKVLLADDSVTAQHMGKKILSDAGYDVITVSNGAAAVKKIASDKPDILILDVFMPGYSGLEVCEKVKSSPDTASVPVLLTVGQMEPYQAEDGNRVKADGIMIKPFEATDLTAAMERFAKKLAPPPEPAVEKTMKLSAVVEEDDESYAAWKSEAPEHDEQARPAMEMSAERGAAPAFGFDEEAAPPAPAFSPTSAFSVDGGGAGAAPAFEISAPAADAAPAFEITAPPESAPAFEIPSAAEPAGTSAYDLIGAPSPEPEAAPAFLDLSPGAESAAPEEAAPAVEIAPPAELEYNAAAPVEVAAVTAPEFEPTSISTPELPITQDSALVTNADDLTQFTTKFGVENPEPMPVGIAEPAPQESVMAEIPEIPAGESVIDLPPTDTGKLEVVAEEAAESVPDEGMVVDLDAHADAEAAEHTVLMPRMDEPESAAEVEPTLLMPRAEEAPAEVEHTVLMSQLEEPVAVEPPAPAAPAPLEEEEHFVPSASNLSLEEEMRRAFSSLPAHPPSAAAAMVESASTTPSTGMEMVPAVAAATGMDEEKVALALGRVVDRFKGQLIVEIMRELKNM